MPKVTCAKCNGEKKITVPFFHFWSRQVNCEWCKATGKVNMFEPEPQCAKPFGQRKIPLPAVTPSYVVRPTIPLDRPLSAADFPMDALRTRFVMQGIADSLEIPLEAPAQQNEVYCMPHNAGA